MRLLRLLPGAALLLVANLSALPRWDLIYHYDKIDSALAFLDLEFFSAERGVAAAMIFENRRTRPVVGLTADGGRTWSFTNFRESALSLFFLNDQTGWLVGERARVYSTADGGRTWTRLNLAGIRAEPLRIYFRDASHGWLLCSREQAFQTADGGRTWTRLPDSDVPGVDESRVLYNEAAWFRDNVLLIGFSRPFARRSRFPAWMEPDLAPVGLPPTTSILLRSSDAGRSFTRYLLPGFGEVRRLAISSLGAAFLLAVRPDSLTSPTEIYQADLATLQTRSVYADKNRWLTDLAFGGAGRLFAAAIDQEGRSPHPAIPSKLRVLASTDGRKWAETEIDYRAEAHRGFFAASGPDIWLATDSGMLLRWVPE